MIREALPEDVPAMTQVRISVRENHMSVEGMAARGITPATITAGMRDGSYGSWIAETAGTTFAFAMADRRDGSIFALFVMPGFEGQGFGTSLLQRCEEFLAQNGFGEAWLSTGRDTAAARFYARRGWRASGVDPGDVLSIIFRNNIPSP